MSIFKRFIIISVYAHIIINNSNSQEIITQEHSQHIFYGSENFREIGGSFAQTASGDLDGDGRDDLILSGKNQDGDGVMLIYRGGSQDVWIGDGAFTHNGIENAGAVYLYLGETVSNVGIAPLLK